MTGLAGAVAAVTLLRGATVLRGSAESLAREQDPAPGFL